jgi:hypothetical protein
LPCMQILSVADQFSLGRVTSGPGILATRERRFSRAYR